MGQTLVLATHSLTRGEATVQHSCAFELPAVSTEQPSVPTVSGADQTLLQCG
jgi:hypothetical protein